MSGVVGRHSVGHTITSARRPQHVRLLLADLVGQTNSSGSRALGDQRQADAGVPGRRLDDGSAGSELTAGLGGVDRLHRDLVLAAHPGQGDLGNDVLEPAGTTEFSRTRQRCPRVHRRVARSAWHAPGAARPRRHPATSLGISRRPAMQLLIVAAHRVASGIVANPQPQVAIWLGQTHLGLHAGPARVRAPLRGRHEQTVPGHAHPASGANWLDVVERLSFSLPSTTCSCGQPCDQREQRVERLVQHRIGLDVRRPAGSLGQFQKRRSRSARPALPATGCRSRCASSSYPPAELRATTIWSGPASAQAQPAAGSMMPNGNGTCGM